jgi:hypothetical protein
VLRHVIADVADLAALKAERDDLAAKRDLVDVAPRESGPAQV